MKLCEICGAKEEYETTNQEHPHSVTLHICESCRGDRKFTDDGEWFF